MTMHNPGVEISKASQYFPRQALDQLFRECKDRPVFLINAPSGSGKSAFVSHLVNAGPGAVCWYNLAPEDSDPATFLSHFRLMVEREIGQKMAFPPFAGDYLSHLDVYVEQLFSALLIGMGEAASLVFDDYHLLQVNSPVHRLLNLLSKQLLSRQRLMVLSRAPIMFPAVRWSDEKHILRLDWSHFKLSNEELGALIQRQAGAPVGEDMIARLALQTEGLIAEVLLHFDYDEKLIPDIEFASDRQMILKQSIGLSEERWQQLCLLAEFPVIEAKLIRGMKLDMSIMDDLGNMAMRGKLVSQRQADPAGFRLHDMMRDHLRRIRQDALSPDKLDSHFIQLAEVMLESGQEYDALRLLTQAGTLDRIVAVIATHAPDWLQQGKYYTLGQALKLLDGSEHRDLPWMRFFQGALHKFSKPGYAISLFQKALDGFSSQPDQNGEKRALGELLDTIQYHGGDFNIASPLLLRAMAYIEHTPVDQADASDAMLAAYAGVMFLIHKGEPKQALHCIEYAATITDRTPGFELLGSYLYVYHAITCDVVGNNLRAGESFARAEALYEGAPEHPPHRFMYNFLASVHEIFLGSYRDSLKRGLETLEYMRLWGLQQHDEHLLTRVAESQLGIGDLDSVSELLSKLDKIPRRSTFSRAVMLQIEAHFWLEKDQPYQAQQAAQHSIHLMDAIGAEIYRHSTRSLLAVALTELGDFEQAEAIQVAVLKWADHAGSELQRFTSLIQQAWRYRRENRPKQMRMVLRHALEVGASHGLMTTYHWMTTKMSYLLSVAMEHDIEREYVRSLIAWHDLPPPENLSSENAWPWRIKIYCFGKPKVVIDGKPVSASAWKGGKTFALLLALLVDGGDQVPVDTLIDRLWPDAEGDKAKQNFEFTLRRLRAVLRLPDSQAPLIELKAGRLSLNSAYCWADNRVFDKLLKLAGASVSVGIDAELPADYRHQAIALYRGAFLSGLDVGWARQRRQQLRQRLLFTLSTVLQGYRDDGEWQKIADLCRQMLAIEPGAEVLQVALQQALLNLGPE